MRRLPEFFRSLIVTAFVLLVLSPAGASAKKDECPWGYEQTMMLQHDRWSSLKLFEEFHSFDRKSLPPNCRKRVGYLYATVLKTIKNRASFLHVALRTTAEVRADRVEITIDDKKLSDSAGRKPGQPYKPGRYSLKVKVPNSGEGRIPVVRVRVDGEEIQPLSGGAGNRYDLELKKKGQHKLSVTIAYAEAKCYLMQVRRKVDASFGDAAVTLTLHGSGASVPLDAGGNKVAAYPNYALEVSMSDSIAHKAAVRVRLNGHDAEQQTLADGSKRWTIAVECSPTKRKRGSLVVDVVPSNGETTFSSDDDDDDDDDEEVDEPSGPGKKLSPLFWVGVAGTGVGAVGFVVAKWGIQAPNEDDANAMFVEKGCDTQATSCDKQAQDEIFDLYDASDLGKTIAISSLVFGGASAVLAGFMYFTAPDEDVAADTASFHVSPILGSDSTGLSVFGTF